MKDFKDKVAFITGGASGAGFGQAKVFSEAGCKVAIADIGKTISTRRWPILKNRRTPASMP